MIKEKYSKDGKKGGCAPYTDRGLRHPHEGQTRGSRKPKKGKDSINDENNLDK